MSISDQILLIVFHKRDMFNDVRMENDQVFIAGEWRCMDTVFKYGEYNYKIVYLQRLPNAVGVVCLETGFVWIFTRDDGKFAVDSLRSYIRSSLQHRADKIKGGKVYPHT